MVEYNEDVAELDVVDMPEEEYENPDYDRYDTYQDYGDELDDDIDYNALQSEVNFEHLDICGNT